MTAIPIIKPKPPMPTGFVMRPESCAKCKLSHPIPNDTTLECRRNPPTPNVILIQQLPPRAPVPQILTCFPQMRPDQWCGEFSPLDKDTN
jgi:hypothetical protein